MPVNATKECAVSPPGEGKCAFVLVLLADRANVDT